MKQKQFQGFSLKYFEENTNILDSTNTKKIINPYIKKM